MDPQDRFGPFAHWEEYTDNELMARASAGYPKAYETLVLRYRREAWHYCYSLMKNEAWAEDIVQDCFVDIYVRREDYKDTFSFRTYLYAIIRHKSADYLRKAGRACFVQEDFLDAVALKESSPEEEYLKKESRDHVMEWLRELPDHQREALYLFCVEGMSYGEIARHMGKTAAQIKIWIYRARKKLQKRRMTDG